ncbi:hybrid-cluster NAD(P)-dependent oxidoreductase [Paraburkholderia rhynchosiae]|nr:hybrid-cluster NAD(P)-dependent oxidoreductase [Paraburkholderia rhynchosiae]PMS28859.1 hybrid-cluster NAD(P)-dependent oxidoreductase [Paraburkholderia rhynchosiae]
MTAIDRLAESGTWAAIPASWSSAEKKPLVCIRVVQETRDVRSFFFTGFDGHPFSFEPGQFVTLSLNIDGQAVDRCYTISSPPTRPHTFSITVKRVPSGMVSNWLHDNIRPGTTVEAYGPSGAFTPMVAPTATKYLYLSAGSGVTPLMSMLRAGMDLGLDRDIVFMHSARTPLDIVFRRELDAALSTADRLQILHVCEGVGEEPDWNGSIGRLTPTLLEQLVPDFRNREVFICGPAGYMQSVKEILKKSGHDPARYHEESFNLDAEEYENLHFPESSAKTEAIAPSESFVIRLARSGKSFSLDGAKSILVAAKREGAKVASSCSQGMCGTCKTSILEGTVDMKHNGGIRQREIDKGMCLICCSTPTSDVVLDL